MWEERKTKSLQSLQNWPEDVVAFLLHLVRNSLAAGGAGKKAGEEGMDGEEGISCRADRGYG